MNNEDKARENTENNIDRGSLEKGAEEFLDKHGSPSFAYLQSLVDDGNPRAIELLKEIARQHDVKFADETPPDTIVEMIVLALKNK